jgi:hypothetical protein
MPADLAALAPKLDPLIRRLASNFDGEKLTSLLALERVLAAHGASFNDLADNVVAGAKPPRVIVVKRDAPPRRRSLLALAEGLLDHAGLSRWESGFVESLHARLQDGRRLSAKQRALLTEIYEHEYEVAA